MDLARKKGGALRLLRLLTILSLILVVLLFPPATLALISNNAVPGDATYPIKRKLEDVIFSVASVNPVTKAWFSAARSDRRFQEIGTLINQGKQADQTLQELVEQTQSTADEISQIKDEGQKNMLRQQLAQSIEKYDQGLEKLSQQRQTEQPQVSSQPTSGPVFGIPSPTVTPVTSSTPRPETTGSPRPIPTPTPTPTPPPAGPLSNCDQIEDEIERARCELEELKSSLSAPSPTPRVDRDRDRDGDGGKDEDKNLTPKDGTDKIREEDERR